MHVHAFSPLEVLHGATTLGCSLEEFLRELKAAGLATLPGTAAEILDDEVRAIICPDKLTTAQWLEVMRTAHKVGLQEHRDDHVRTCRRADALGTPSAAHPRSAGGNRRLYGVCAAALRAHGSADVARRAGAFGARLFAKRC